MMNEKFVAALAWMPLRPLKWLVSKVLITSWFNDKILEHHFLVHEGCVIMMFIFHRNQKVVFQNFIIELTGDKYFSIVFHLGIFY